MKMDQSFWQQLSALLDQKLDEKLDEKLAPLIIRIEKIEQRLDKIEQKLEIVEQRLGIVEQRLDKIDEKLDLYYQYFLDMMAAISRLEIDMQTVKLDIAMIKESLETHYIKITQITRNLPAMRDDIQILYTRVSKLEKLQ